MEFDSGDEEGREAEAKRKRQHLSRYIVDKELPERRWLCSYEGLRFFLQKIVM